MAQTEQLAGILRARAIAVDDAQLDGALKDGASGPELVEWAATHLVDDTLLTLDELELYDALQRSGRDEQLAVCLDDAQGDGVQVSLPLSDDDLRAATAALERSTETIRKQTDRVRQQQDAVAKLEALSSTTGTASRAAFAARHQQRWDAARTDLAADVERLSRALDDRVADLSQQNRALAQRVQQTVDGLCRSDDTLLASLQKLGWALPAVASRDAAQDAATQQQQASIARLRDICLHLIKYAVETIRTKLDRLYLEALEAGTASAATASGSSTPDDDVAALQQELESLYAEILPVAQMSVEQQHLAPALKALSGKNAKNLTRSLLALDYVDECLVFLLEHLSLLTTRIDTAAAHYATADALVAAARAELAVQIPTASARAKAAHDQRRRLSNYGSPVRRRPSTGASHMRTRSGTVSGTSSMTSVDLKAQRRRSSGYGAGSSGLGGSHSGSPQAAMDQLLENLSLVLPIEDPLDAGLAGEGEVSASSVDTATRINARFLAATLADRTTKAHDVVANAHEAFETATFTHLADARRAEWLVRSSVLAESPFGAVQLADPEIDGSIAVMADEVRRLAERRAAVEADLAKVQRNGSAKRDRIIARWA
ncbi:hypothetical protein SPBR_02571 [Sporothrix brasiliensis 5110]|uniref:Uncharacterized protein n=1 Tax=Sporothrix brasiliensis 5110 TaxID=1398154 RepID=A0A0C2J5T0_9PEZI|nr:uncharacterized protein SPBR_02571 [Sporothrix brasiliensis 5110]KIH92412.1 hypothetical protein SPBR_02571 [Sporothrix brasiliensis 5110]